MKTFKQDTSFYNWIPGSGEPTKSYTTKSDAENEAKRLCEQTGKKVLTLAIWSSVEPAPKTVKTEYEYLPF